MRRRFKTRNLLAPVLGFGVLLFSGVVYAAMSGNLDFSGTVSRNSNCALNIESAINVDPSTTSIAQADHTIAASVDSATRNILTFSTNLEYQADAKHITFQVMNVGNCIMELEDLVIHQAPDNGVQVTWPDLDGIVLEPGETTGSKTIVVAWVTNPGATTDEKMQASIAYHQQ